MSWAPPAASPPAAYPPLPPAASRPVASSSSSSPRSNPWAANSGSFYLGGSAAPSSMATRKAPPFKGRSATHRTLASPSPPPRPRPAPPHPSTPPSPPVLLTEGVCCCCATTLRYPRASPSFRCTVCTTVVDLSDAARKGKARQGPSLVLSSSPALAHQADSEPQQERRYLTRHRSPRPRSSPSSTASPLDTRRPTTTSRTASAPSSSPRPTTTDNTTRRTRSSPSSRPRSTTCPASRRRSDRRRDLRPPPRPAYLATARSSPCTTSFDIVQSRSTYFEGRSTRSCADLARPSSTATAPGSFRSSRCVLLSQRPPVFLERKLTVTSRYSALYSCPSARPTRTSGASSSLASSACAS